MKMVWNPDRERPARRAPPVTQVPETARRGAEGHALSSQEAAEVEHRLPHRGEARPGLPDAPHRQEARRYGQADPSGGDLLEAVGERGQYQGMADDGARGRGVEAKTPGALGGQRQRDVYVAPAPRVIVDADSVEAGVLAVP